MKSKKLSCVKVSQYPNHTSDTVPFHHAPSHSLDNVIQHNTASSVSSVVDVGGVSSGSHNYVSHSESSSIPTRELRPMVYTRNPSAVTSQSLQELPNSTTLNRQPNTQVPCTHAKENVIVTSAQDSLYTQVSVTSNASSSSESPKRFSFFSYKKK
jgi:hypothetical protein